ncbi:MAG: hypothetical protein DVB25_07545 [Verrucomicrobia bacterium]|nr:MAG: hypothetical protein DVB25_07545 [Verrucomicrobiota bacterium]
MKPKLYIFGGPGNYWKLSAACTGGRNEYGIIDSDFRLNGKRKISGLKMHPDFKEKKGASTAGGSGYIGHVQFSSFDKAKEFLEKYYDVRMG